MAEVADDLRAATEGQVVGIILDDSLRQFQNRNGKVAFEHRRLSRYGTMTAAEIASLPVADFAAPVAHLYVWVPNALLSHGLAVMAAWDCTYKANIVWHKIRKDGGSDGRGVGFYFRNVTELLLFGTRGPHARTLAAGRRQVNLIDTRKREYFRRPDEIYPIIEACSPGPRLELFARGVRDGWTVWGNEATDDCAPRWARYAHNSAAERRQHGLFGSD
ncbi:S-adenosylmethionine-binding protein [Elioraea sp. Yellowstone]|jgi:N6-adenosine-specific RNA methylase IME4|uniref:MT-A70 family methyltransferase n=1 Tax=Elioraea sp. Yellowstone TaxID=2592070 RepID=UPI0011517B04|nr:MT-A70 family methyltransferase [Elioraea sp. Yellowstone]TQF80368.1 S-adenosylmethionine-binding protein [Elioraea sp. Yellowstone]